MADPIPEGYPPLSVSLAVEDAAQAIDFYKQAFGATERMKMPAPGGKIGHAELAIGDAIVMLSDQFEGSSSKPPKELGGTSVSMFLYVEDVDAFAERAVDAGATVTMPIDDMFWGDRFGVLSDPFGHQWSVATHKEDVPPEEMEKRGQEAMAAMSES
jgi:PhnB protein